ncbi:MAG: response regulator [Anaeromyxobacter sp.]|nr:response regulator [Anaeromyxobacter sp.]
MLTAGLLLAAATAAPLLVLPGRLEARDRLEEERRAVDLARAFAGAGEVAIDFGDQARAAEVLRGLQQVKGPVYARLRGPDGWPLAVWGTPPLAAVAAAPPAAGLEPVVGDEGGLIHATVPVITRSGQRGALELGLGLEGLGRRRDEARALVSVTASVIFLVGLVAAAGLLTLLVRPLEQVTEVAGRIARGEEGAARHLDATERGEAGAMASALGGVVDQLVAQRAMLEAQNEASDDGILTLGLDGKVLVHNRRFRQLCELPVEALVGGAWPALRQRLQPLLAAPLPAWLEADAPALPVEGPATEELACQDGRHVELHAAPIRTPHGAVSGLSLTFRDVTVVRQAEARVRNLNVELEARVAIRTGELARANAELATRLEELHRTQDQLVQADRAIAIGRLAAGVAHEINNPLAYVAANLKFVREHLPTLGPGTPPPDGTAAVSVEELQEALADAADGSARVARIVSDLKAYSRPTAEERVPTSLEGAMEAALSMAAHELRHRATVVRHYQPAPLAVADRVRLSQVFLNLLLNAAQAIPPGAADLHLVTATVGVGEGGWPFAEVRDTGCGIPADVLGRIFDPFFTTRPLGQGTGLGLSTSQGIVTGLDGRIEVWSEPGHGSAFRVLLPPAGPAPAGPDGPALTPPLRAGRLLVLDDEPAIGAAVRRMLAGALEVEVATCPRQVLDRVAAGERFDHLLCDLMMPVMTGMQFEAELVLRAPEQAERLVFMTGGAFTEAAAAFVERNRARCLDKPFDLDTLRSALHAIRPA